MKLSLSKLNFLNIFLTATIFSIVISIFTTKIITDNYTKKITTLESEFIESNKQLVKKEVERVIERVKNTHNKQNLLSKKILSEKSDFVISLIKQDTSLKNEKDFLKKYSHILDSLEWEDKTGYFYIFNRNGEVLYHKKKAHIGSNIFKVMESNSDFKNFIEISLTKKEHFGKYKWPKLTGEKSFTKYVFSKEFAPWEIFIVAGSYIDEMGKNLKEGLFKEIERDRFGKENYGYFWLHDLNSVMKIHPFVKSVIDKEPTPELKVIFDGMNKLVLKQDAGYYKYQWYLPGEKIKDEKISYIYLIKEWDLVLGSGFYLTELKALIQKEKEELEKDLEKNLLNIFSILAVLFLLSLLVAIFVSNRIRKIEISRKEELNMLNQYKLILDSSSVVSKTDPSGTIIYINKTFTKISGFSEKEVIGKPHNIVRHPQTPKAQFKKMWETIKSGKVWTGVIKNRRKDGSSYFNRTTIVPIKDSSGNIIEFISSATDITEMINNKDKLRNIFNTDSLTGLGNRFKLINSLGQNSSEILALINIDRFREVNDLYGNRVGDSVIQTFSRRIFEYFGNDNYQLFRVQGDVLGIYSWKKTKEELITEIESFINVVGKIPYKHKEHNFILSYSVGIAHGEGELLAWADLALGQGKKRKKQIEIYDPSSTDTKEYEENIIWVNKITEAIKSDNIVPYYQPIFNYKTNKIDKYECLMRLIDNQEAISPFKFLDVAKRTKLYPELTYKMIEKSIDTFSGTTFEFSINLSVEDLLNNEIMTFLYDYGDKKGIFSQLVLEIVESEEMESYDEVIETINRFKKAGARIAIDDFGSGYSNYDYLISLQADFIKVDGSIVKHLVDDKRTQDVVKSIITFAKKSNIKTIAEYVSSQELDAILRDVGVDYAQGYLYGKPEESI